MRILLIVFFGIGICSAPVPGGERANSAGNPPLLSSHALPEPKVDPNRTNGLKEGNAPLTKAPEVEEDSIPPRRRGWLRRDRAKSQDAGLLQPEQKEMPAGVKPEGKNDSADNENAGDALYTTEEAMALLAAESSPPPTPEAVEVYRTRLEARLLERYNNTAEHGGKVAMVRAVLSKPLETSIDGSMIRAEFDQLVYDHWGRRLPDLEKEYFVVTFGLGGVQQVRSDPSIRVGLDMEKTYSERAPLAADPFRNVDDSEAFRSAPRAKMPEWWRPEFPELD